jgi:hypothetical protein
MAIGGSKRFRFRSGEEGRTKARVSRGNKGFITIGMASVVLVVSAALGLGAPEHATLLSLLSGHGWLTEDTQGQVVLANGQTGHVDFRDTVTTAKGDILEVVQTGTSAVLVDRTTGTAGTLNLSDTTGQAQVQTQNQIAGDGRGSLGTPADPDAQNELVPTNGVDLFDIHKGSGEIALLDPVTGHVVSEKKVGGDLTSGVVDQHGVLWVESRATGAMIGVGIHAGTLQVKKVNNSVVAPGDSVLLSAVNGSPAVLDCSRGVFFLAPGGVPATAVDIHPASLARSAVISPVISGSTVPMAAPGTVILVQGSHVQAVDLPGTQGDRFGPPVPFGSKIYVPDLRTGTVYILTDQGHATGQVITVSGQPDLLTVAIQNGALFVNNPDSPHAFAVPLVGSPMPINEADPNAPTNVSVPTTVPVVTPTTIVPTAPGSSPGGSTVAPTAPSAPVDPQATPGNAQVTVSWSASNDDGSPIKAYTISWSAAGGGSVSVAGNQESKVISNLANGQVYTFSVRATNSVGTGPGAQTPAVKPVSTTPGAPTGPIKATPEQDGSILVAWGEADAGGLSISGYTVTPVAADGSTLTPVVSSGTGLSLDIGASDGIIIGTSYTFTVSAMSTSGIEGPVSVASNMATASSNALAVTNLTGTATGRGTITVTWDSCVDACATGSTVTSYEVSLSPPTQSPIPNVPAAPGGTQTAPPITGLTDGTSYTVTVTPVNAWGPGQPTSEPVTTEGAPTATITGYTANQGPSVTVNFTVDFHGATPGNNCNIANLSGGASSPSGSCSSLTASVPTYNTSYSGGTLSVTTPEFATTAVASVNFSSGLKNLDADATPDYGPTTPGDKYSGPNSGTCPQASFVNCAANLAGGATVYGECWENGGLVNNLQSAVSTETQSDVWIEVSGPASGFMISMWFKPGVPLGADSTDPSTSPAAQQLPHC